MVLRQGSAVYVISLAQSYQLGAVYWRQFNNDSTYLTETQEYNIILDRDSGV